jgi:hypothetical protein
LLFFMLQPIQVRTGNAGLPSVSSILIPFSYSLTTGVKYYNLPVLITGTGNYN